MFSLKYLVIVLQHADVGYRLIHHSKRLKSDKQKLYIEGGQILKIEQHNALYKSEMLKFVFFKFLYIQNKCTVIQVLLVELLRENSQQDIFFCTFKVQIYKTR
jgi:hypothetical protein